MPKEGGQPAPAAVVNYLQLSAPVDSEPVHCLKLVDLEVVYWQLEYSRLRGVVEK